MLLMLIEWDLIMEVRLEFWGKRLPSLLRTLKTWVPTELIAQSPSLRIALHKETQTPEKWREWIQTCATYIWPQPRPGIFPFSKLGPFETIFSLLQLKWPWLTQPPQDFCSLGSTVHVLNAHVSSDKRIIQLPPSTFDVTSVFSSRKDSPSCTWSIRLGHSICFGQWEVRSLQIPAPERTWRVFVWAFLLLWEGRTPDDAPSAWALHCEDMESHATASPKLTEYSMIKK